MVSPCWRTDEISVPVTRLAIDWPQYLLESARVVHLPIRWPLSSKGCSLFGCSWRITPVVSANCRRFDGVQRGMLTHAPAEVLRSDAGYGSERTLH